ncbi:DUF1385 domain-containing protein [Candidatus Woesearchaeota archaeon]|jgi:uncharacterized protein YqhQ|nr:DUF1385 domain-containing protein [Candidatus Woesearchaeota archaeon]MBT6518678.1 DUF1385 domain-containing protein [Candidatus Woesearchaeota archaeon]
MAKKSKKTKPNPSKKTKSSKNNNSICAIGGQAVIEGVMMKNKNKVAVAIRKPNKKIKVKKIPYKNPLNKSKIFKLPVLRGIVTLVDTLVLGMKTLNYSASESLDEDQQISKREMIITTIIAIAFAIGIFVIAPLYITKTIVDKGFLFNLIDGIMRLVLFIAYILVISLMSDIRRVFQYHGAEHKTIACYEAKKPLTIKNVKKFPTVHRRCGTTFILIVLVVATLVFSLIIWEGMLIRIASRIILIPFIAGISYELLKLGAKYPKNILLNILIIPGLWIQKLTTREPDNKQIEVAIESVKAVLK